MANEPPDGERAVASRGRQKAATRGKGQRKESGRLDLPRRRALAHPGSLLLGQISHCSQWMGASPTEKKIAD